MNGSDPPASDPGLSGPPADADAQGEHDARLRMALDAAGMGLWSWDAASDRVVWDPQMCRIFGVEPAHAPRDYAAYRVLIHADDRDEVERTIATGMQTGTYPDVEHRVVWPDGSVHWVLAKATIHRDPAGRPHRIVGGAVDITERKLRDEQLRHAQKMDAIGHLTAGIAHNFNNLLMAILPNVGLARAASPVELPAILDDIELAGRRGAELVKQLMAFSRGRRPRSISLAPLATTVAQVVALCRGSFPRELTISLADRSRPGAMCEPTALQQALLNVLLNARDALAGRLGGRIGVMVEVVDATEVAGGAVSLPADGERAGRYARVTIEDNGPGMDEATLRRLCEPFFTTRPPGGGAGLGLAVSYALLREVGGAITCRSTIGAGSTFTLCVPVADAVRVTEPPAPAPVAAIGGRDILVVDDEPLVRRALTRILELAGHRVTAVDDGEAALAAWDRPGAFALALVDLAMPGIGGAEVRARLLARDPGAKVVFVTGYGRQGLPAGVEGPCLTKPVEPEALLSTIATVIGGG